MNEPQRFKLVRDEDATGVSGTGHVADGIVWHDGTVTIHWRTEHTSTTVYKGIGDVVAIHGHGGKTRVAWHETPFEHGKRNALQDQMENAPFASIGGLDARQAPTTPDYVTDELRAEWLCGYEFACRGAYGDDWRTCRFGWSAAVTIGDAPAEPRTPAQDAEIADALAKVRAWSDAPGLAPLDEGGDQ